MASSEFAESPAIQVKKKAKKWRWIVPGVLVAITMIDQAWVWLDRRFTVGYDTTRITSPLDHGYPDYLAWLNQKYGAGVTADNNAAPLILEIVGPGDATAAQLKEIYRIWGIPQPAGKPVYEDFVTWAAQAAPQMTDGWTQLEAAGAAPWKPAEHPDVAKWLGEMEPALGALEKATGKPRFFIPLVTGDGHSSGWAGFLLVDDVDLSWLGAAKGLSSAARARAMNRLEAGDDAGFERDIMMCLRFSRLIAQQPTLIEHVVGQAVDEGALESLQGAAASELLDAKTAAQMRAQLAAMDPFPTPAHAIDEAERFAVLEFMCQLHETAAGSPGGLPRGAFRMLPVDYNDSMREINGIFDRPVHVYDLPTYDQQHAAMAALVAEVNAHEDRAGTWHWKRFTHLMADFSMAILFPSLDRVAELSTADAEDRDLALTALALREAKWRSGAFPDALADLKGAGFDAPLDRFSGRPLIYHRKGEGYVLYSVGPDQKDDGGVPRSDAQSGRGWDMAVKAEK